MALHLTKSVLIALLGFVSTVCAQSSSPHADRPAAATGPVATVTKGVNIDGVSFKVGESFTVESFDKVTSSAVTTRNGKKLRVPLRNLEIEKAPPQPTGNVAVIRAEYGVPGITAANVTSKVQELVNQFAPGTVPEILASADLLKKEEPARAGRASAKKNESGGGPTAFGTPAKNTLTISYTVNGEERTAEAIEGDKVVLK